MDELKPLDDGKILPRKINIFQAKISLTKKNNESARQESHQNFLEDSLEDIEEDSLNKSNNSPTKKKEKITEGNYKKNILSFNEESEAEVEGEDNKIIENNSSESSDTVVMSPVEISNNFHSIESHIKDNKENEDDDETINDTNMNFIHCRNCMLLIAKCKSK